MPAVLSCQGRERASFVEPDKGIELPGQGSFRIVAGELRLGPVDDADEAFPIVARLALSQRALCPQVKQEAGHPSLMAKPLVAIGM